MEYLNIRNDYNILFTYEDYKAAGPPNFNQIVSTSVAYFLGLFIYNGFLYLLLTMFSCLHRYLGSAANRFKFARQFTAFTAFTYLVYDGVMLAISKEAGDMFSNDLAFGSERLYTFSPTASRMCMFHVAWEIKNFFDSVYAKDGIEHIIHHAVTATLAYFGLNPYLHMYAGFFFGLSEISSMALALIVLFVNDRHSQVYIQDIEKDYPTLQIVIGGYFSLMFFLVRIVAWPYVSYLFWKDNYALYMENKIHSYTAFYTFLIANILLTSLQIFWFKDIVKNLIDVLGGGAKDKKE